MIEISHLTHAYGPLPVLEDVSLGVAPGQIVGLVGPNGAGKTTLMRAVATLLRPSEGAVRVGGCDTREAPDLVRWMVGFLPERTSLYPELTSREYLDLFADMAGHAREVRRRRVAEALGRISLTDRRETPTRELSKGLRQRLALQATLMHDPRALVLDEPTDGLDPISRQDVLAEIRALAAGGRAVMVSSHVLAEMEEVADQVFVLAKGKLAGDDPEVAPRYAVRVRGDVEAVRAFLSRRSEVVAATVSKGRVVIDLAPGTPDASAIAQALCAAGFVLVELSEEHSRLAQRFERAVKDS
jgi:ABC-type multidrug transport system ATPase subunit